MFCGNTLCPIDSTGQPLNIVKTAKTSNMFCGSTLCLIDSMGQPVNLVKTAKAASNMFCGSTVCPIDSTGQPLNLVKLRKQATCSVGAHYVLSVPWGSPLSLSTIAKAASNMFGWSTLCAIDSTGPPLNLVFPVQVIWWEHGGFAMWQCPILLVTASAASRFRQPPLASPESLSNQSPAVPWVSRKCPVRFP